MNKISLSLYSFIIIFLAIITGCDLDSKILQQSDIQRLADNLQVKYELVQIQSKHDCLNDEALNECYLFQLSLTMPMPFDKQGWEIYFSQKNLIIKTQSRNFSIEKINGELHRLFAKPYFTGFEQEKTITILLTSKAVELEDALLLPNFYVMSKDLKTALIKNTCCNL